MPPDPGVPDLWPSRHGTGTTSHRMITTHSKGLALASSSPVSTVAERPDSPPAYTEVPAWVSRRPGDQSICDCVHIERPGQNEHRAKVNQELCNMTSGRFTGGHASEHQATTDKACDSRAASIEAPPRQAPHLGRSAEGTEFHECSPSHVSHGGSSASPMPSRFMKSGMP